MTAISLRTFLVIYTFTVLAALPRGQGNESFKFHSSSAVWQALVQTLGITLDAVIGDRDRRSQNSIRNTMVLVRRAIREVSSLCYVHVFSPEQRSSNLYV